LKESTPFGGIPVVKIHDKTYSQNNSLLRFVGKQAGLYPQDALQALCTDEVIDAVEDFVSSKMAPTMRAAEDQKKTMREEIANVSGPHFLGQLEKVLARNGCGAHPWVNGSDVISIADLKLYHLVAWIKSGSLDHIPATLCDAYPHIIASYNATHTERAKHH